MLVPVLCGALICALVLLMQEGGGEHKSTLMGGGIDEYLGDKYGQDSSNPFGAFAARAKAHSTHFARRLGLTTFKAPKSLSNQDDNDNSAGSSIDSLKKEEALDAAAEGTSKSLRKPCAGKPCFDVIDGLSK